MLEHLTANKILAFEQKGIRPGSRGTKDQLLTDKMIGIDDPLCSKPKQDETYHFGSGKWLKNSWQIKNSNSSNICGVVHKVATTNIGTMLIPAIPPLWMICLYVPKDDSYS